MWPSLSVDVERVAPFVLLIRELIEAVRIGRCGRLHLANIQIPDLVLHHHRDGLRLEDLNPVQLASMEQCLKEHHVVLRGAVCAATAHEKFRPLRHLERHCFQAAISLSAETCRDTALLLAADQKSRILHSERRKNVLPEIDFQRLIANSFDQLTSPVHADAVLPSFPGSNSSGTLKAAFWQVAISGKPVAVS